MKEWTFPSVGFSTKTIKVTSVSVGVFFESIFCKTDIITEFLLDDLTTQVSKGPYSLSLMKGYEILVILNTTTSFSHREIQIRKQFFRIYSR